MAIFDNLVELLHGVGGAVGAGGGLVAAKLYQRLDGARKDAKKALKIAEDLTLELKVFKDGDLASKAYVVQEISRVVRGSFSGVELDKLVDHRLKELERRMSAIEDQFDETQKENRAWAEEIREILGRLEGTLQSSRRSG